MSNIKGAESQAFIGNQNLHLSRFLDDVGDGSGLKNAILNYTGGGVGPKIYSIKPARQEIFRIARMTIIIQSNAALSEDKYVPGGALSEGIQVRKQDDGGTLVDYTDEMKVTTVGEWAGHCDDITPTDFGGGVKLYIIHCLFLGYGQFLRLDGINNERLEVTLDDNFTTLLRHTFKVKGYIKG